MPSSGSMRVLMVHSGGEPSRRLTDRLLSSNGPSIQAVVIESVAEACERLTEEEFDVILLDLALKDEPGLDGFIRLNAQVPETPVVVITSPATQKVAAAALEAGAADSLVRNAIDVEQVAEILSAVVQRSRFQDAIRRRTLLDERTGLYSRKGFILLAPKHLALAAHGRKSLLLSAFELDQDLAAPDAVLEAAGRVIKRSFRGSDLLAHMDSDRFVALAIVQPGDASHEILERRLREQIHEHNATHDQPAHLRFRSEMVRVQPGHSWSVEDLLGALPNPTTILE
ncbi:MAG TPA: response regulator [Thermoanaerobaculia bacterium]|nr:response regulator [Thermoanaerobaculia bacterium]